MELCLQKHKTWIDPINNSLLIGYYFLNIGIALLKIQTWSEITLEHQVIESVAYHTGFMLLLLGSIHVVNLSSLIIMLFNFDQSIKTWFKNFKNNCFELNRDDWKKKYRQHRKLTNT